MAIRGNIVSLNLVAQQAANQHLLEVGAMLQQAGITHEELFYTNELNTIRQKLQQRRVYLLYLVAHAELDKGLSMADRFWNNTEFISLFGGHLPKYVFVNACYGFENKVGELFVQHGSRYVLVGEGFLSQAHAYKYGLRFFEVLIKYRSASRAIYYIDVLKSAQYRRYREK